MFKKTIESFNAVCNEILEANETTLCKAGSGITLCNKTLTDLKEILDKKDFNAVPEEIAFFKNIKPIPMSLLFFFRKHTSMSPSEYRLKLKFE
jgi:hypothetical protein